MMYVTPNPLRYEKNRDRSEISPVLCGMITVRD